jgi:hypothetical protein
MDRVAALRDTVARLGQSDQAFAQSLLKQAGERGLSDKQLAWVDKLVERANKPKPAPIDVREIVAFMTNAGLKRPQIILAMDGEEDVRLSIAGPGSRTPGHINVTSADKSYSERKFYGRIGPDGRFDPSLSLEPETQTAIVAALQAMASDPAGTAAKYGRVTGECCFCRLPLSDERSLRVGYGKVCSRRYGLPYGTAER